MLRKTKLNVNKKANLTFDVIMRNALTNFAKSDISAKIRETCITNFGLKEFLSKTFPTVGNIIDPFFYWELNQKLVAKHMYIVYCILYNVTMILANDVVLFKVYGR